MFNQGCLTNESGARHKSALEVTQGDLGKWVQSREKMVGTAGLLLAVL